MTPVMHDCSEVLKCGGEAHAAVLHSVFELCWLIRCLSQGFKNANIITLQRPVTRVPPENFSPHLEKCVRHSLKLLDKTLRPTLVSQTGYGPRAWLVTRTNEIGRTVTVIEEFRCLILPGMLWLAYFLLTPFSNQTWGQPSGVNRIVASLGNCLNFPVFVQNRKWPRQLFIRELLYADEAAFMAITTPTLQNFCSSFANACAELDISISKTVVLPQGPSSPLQININVAVLQSMDRFCYLRSTVDNRSFLKSELDIRWGKAATTLRQRRPRDWSIGSLSIRVKIQVYMACVVSVLLCGCETWTTYRPKNAVLTLFTCGVFALPWGCPRDCVPNTSVLRRRVPTTS